MRTCWRGPISRGVAANTLLLLGMMLATTSGNAQVLDLSSIPDPPELDEDAAAPDLRATLEAEIATLVTTESQLVDDRARMLARVSINWRILLSDLLARGHDLGVNGSHAILAGWRCADQRADLDTQVQRAIELLDGDAEMEHQAAAAVTAATRFNTLVLDLIKTADPDTPAAIADAHGRIMTPILDLVAAVSDVPTGSHWPLPAGQTPVASPSPMTIGALRTRLATTSLRDDTRVVIADVLDVLERGATFDELRAAIEAYRGLIDLALDVADTIGETGWLGRDQVTLYTDELHTAIVLFRDRSTRERGEHRLQRLGRTHEIVRRMSALIAQGGDLRRLRAALEVMDGTLSTPVEADGDRHIQLQRILDRMITYTELPNTSLRQDLRLVDRQLRQAYRTAEDALVRELEAVTADPEILADPAFLTLVADHAQYLDDIQRLRTMPTWIESIGLIEPRASARFAAQTRKMSQWLLNANRRPDALVACRQFEQQLDLFYPLPFEAQLRGASANVIRMTGAQHQTLLTTIHNARSAWAMAWGDGDGGGEAATRMMLLYRLMQTAADVAALMDDERDAATLNRWGGWQLPPGMITRVLLEMESRLKLAVASANDRDDDALRRQLDRIDRDMPAIKLAGRLMTRLGPTLATLPDGVTGAIAQTTERPGPDAWMVTHRDAIASVCRYLIELEHAAGTGQERQERAIAAYVNAMATDLLLDLGDRRTPPPTLIGFDGSDPDAREQ